MEDWDKIHRAVQIVKSGAAVRVDGNTGWKVYRAGAMVRIDIHASVD